MKSSRFHIHSLPKLHHEGQAEQNGVDGSSVQSLFAVDFGLTSKQNQLQNKYFENVFYRNEMNMCDGGGQKQ